MNDNSNNNNSNNNINNSSSNNAYGVNPSIGSHVNPETSQSSYGQQVNQGIQYNSNQTNSYNTEQKSLYNSEPISSYNTTQNNSYSTNQSNTYSSTKNNPHTSNQNNSYNTTQGGTHKTKEKKYVSRTAFIFGIIISVVLSSMISAGGFILMNSADFDSVSENEVQNEISSSDNFSIAEATGSSLTVQEIVEKTQDTVVEIRTQMSVNSYFSGTEIVEGAGSGVIIKEDGYIITNNHVIEGATEIVVKLTNGIEYMATVVGADSMTDLALIKIEETGLPFASFGDSTELEVGDLAVAIGNPLGQLGGTSTVGTISALDRQVTVDDTQMTLIQTDAAINEGNSGGGLFDSEGNLIGIVVAKAGGEGIEGLGFAIPSAQVLNISSELYEYGEVTNRPIIGISVVDIHSSEAAASYGVNKLGVYISEVTTQNAIDAGIKSGDIVLAIDDTIVDSSSTLIAEVQSYVVGDTVTLTLDRNGDEIEISVELSAM